MKRDYLGDSYDAVKRLWQQAFAGWAPLYAEPRFLPADLRDDFTRLTGIPMLQRNPPAEFSLLNDPDTGIRLPDEANQAEGRGHISLSTIIGQLRNLAPLCIVTFDQSDYRHSGLGRDQQRQAKMRALSESGALSFYYVSHAPFLFAFSALQAQERAKAILLLAGIPESRLETLHDDA